ncbi:SMP-30/gluconolactonase/LRE family protein [Phenylobacterium sp.]|jgi:gluconolactonase|uniref:SMP-30/gluconolactonase/LRE family protein n=1 Tax=Phenylobacterium sp. TaxID=1871053 RepID=UPI002F421784
MPLSTIPIEAFAKIAVGIDRPEDVVVGPDGRVFASDHQCAVAEIFPDGSFRRLGPKGGAPNGLNMDSEGRILIANFGIYDRQDGPLQRFDPATGRHETLVAEVGGKRLTSANYPVMTQDGCIWCANSTHAETWPQALDGRPDGFLFVLRPDGGSEIVAEGLKFPNGLALSADETTLYCAQTTGPDVLAFPILPGGRLGRGERYGPALGLLQAAPGEPQHDHNDLGYTDGVGVDAEGNVWVCLPAANKVVAILPDKSVVTVFHDPSGVVVNHPTNVTWGGSDLKDLYIGSIRADYVLKARSPLAGQPLIHQR